LKQRHHVTYLALDDGTAAPDAVERAAEYCHEVIIGLKGQPAMSTAPTIRATSRGNRCVRRCRAHDMVSASSMVERGVTRKERDPAGIRHYVQ
jgi:hypothetical protein